jgi:predicted aspartyl protease
MAKIPYHAFSIQYSQTINRLPSEVIVEGEKGASLNARAVWDTGAMRTVITPEVANHLNLVSADFVTVTGVNNIS